MTYAIFGVKGQRMFILGCHSYTVDSANWSCLNQIESPLAIRVLCLPPQRMCKKLRPTLGTLNSEEIVVNSGSLKR